LLSSLLSSIKTLTNFEDYSGCRIKNSVLAFFSAIDLFSPVFSVYPFLDAEEIRGNVYFIAGFRNDFQNH
jgi:hypothetical protein